MVEEWIIRGVTVIWTGFALVLFISGAVSEFLPMDSPSKCLMEKRKITRYHKGNPPSYQCLPSKLKMSDFGGKKQPTDWIEIGNLKKE